MDVADPETAPGGQEYQLHIRGTPRIQTSKHGNDYIRLAATILGDEEYEPVWHTLMLAPTNWKDYKVSADGEERTDKEAKSIFQRICNQRDRAIRDFVDAAGIDRELALMVEERTDDRSGDEIRELPNWKDAKLYAILGEEDPPDYAKRNVVNRVVLAPQA